MNKFSIWWNWAFAMGPRYLLFRSFYELQRRSGLLRIRFPTSPPFRIWISLNQWRKEAPSFFFESRKSLPFTQASEKLKHEAERILAGEVQFFNGDWKKIDLDEWLFNPESGFKYSNRVHWTSIRDFDSKQGDIKYVWEKNRFLFLQTILRYDHAFQCDSAEWVFQRIDSWIDQNPINKGSNFVCSQEISLRIFNWILALYFYRHSQSLTEARFAKIIFSIYWQIKHVRANILFSRISVRNNHALTETLALFSVGLLFPFFEESSEWRRNGEKWFVKEILYQFYDDGGYIQYSFNYQRVALQLVTWAISIGSRHNKLFPENFCKRVCQAVRLMVTCQDQTTGMLPNYGANDGSLFFKWSDRSFRDFRPALDAIHYQLTGQNLYQNTYEDREWLGVTSTTNLHQEKITAVDGCASFPVSGIYTFRKNELLILILCVTYKNRPSQADNLHLDLWYKGENLLIDAGSYRYNTLPEITRYFSGTESHNTVMLGSNDQMTKGPRFIWLNWTESLYAKWNGNDKEVLFSGAIKAFKSRGDFMHFRKVRVRENSGTYEIEVTDEINIASSEKMRQLWHSSNRYLPKILSWDEKNNPLKPEILNRHYSCTYGQIEDIRQIMYESLNRRITTRIFLSCTFYSFF
ncbi:MAG: heparinase II/III family protein, partial [Cyclobacteriaceae bacterium]|nr:heparinase II/III family protein [Cyclobacteriaceae bacterium]